MEKKTKAISKMLKATKREAPKKDFQYLVQRPGKPRLCFGTTQEKDSIKLISRFEIEYTSQASPGMGDPPSDQSAIKPISKLGTVLGGRTAPRDPPLRLTDEIPPPGAYSPKDTFEIPNFALSRMPRFKSTLKQATVGPGYYKPSDSRRTLKFAHSFGGRRTLIPGIQTKCVPLNLDVCEKCKEQPSGDYWQLTDKYGQLKKGGGEQDSWFLCRPCYEKEKRNSELFSRRIVLQFKKVRDCSQIHYHGGCEAKILLLPPREIANMQAKEAYFTLFFT